MGTWTDAARVKKLRRAVEAKIPLVPNTKAARQELQALSFADLLLHYLNWSSRFVASRPRVVSVEPNVTSDSRWPTLRQQIEALLEKVRTGDDLTPHLSTGVHTKGYASASARASRSGERWLDKDFLLNVMGYHHFHLGDALTTKGNTTRTNDLLFARVSRDSLVALGIFDHSVFKSPNDPTTMTPERERLWRLYDEYSARGLPSGTVHVSALVATSGHPLHLVKLAGHYGRLIRDIDPRIDDTHYVRHMYAATGIAMPSRPRIEWELNFQDLGLVDKASNTFFVLAHGSN